MFVLVDMRDVADTVTSVAAALPTESVSTYLQVLDLAAANGLLDPAVHDLSVDAIVNHWTEDDPRWDLLPVGGMTTSSSPRHTPGGTTMSTTQPDTTTATQEAGAAAVAMTFEVTTLPVADVDRAKAFYQRLGWRLDIDFKPTPDTRGVQFTPPGSQASIQFGQGTTTMSRARCRACSSSSTTSRPPATS